MSLIELETVVMVKKGQCPIHSDFLSGDRITFERCKSCPFFITPNKHAWKEYAATIIKEEVENEEDFSRYSKTISCVKCDGDITFASGFSWFVGGECCAKCGTYHYYVKVKNGKPIFLVPIHLGAVKSG